MPRSRPPLRLKVTRAMAALFQQKRVRLSWSEAIPDRLDTVECHPEARIEAYSLFRGGTVPRAVGAFSYSHSRLPAGTTIGRFCSIAERVMQLGDGHPTDRVTSSPVTYHRNAMLKDYLADHGLDGLPQRPFPIREGDFTAGHDVWVGTEAVIGQAVHLGTGCIVAARAVVTRDVPPYAVVGGVPARVIRHRFSEAAIEELLRTAWWDYRIEDLAPLDMTEPASFLPRFREALEAGTLRRADYPVLSGAEIVAAAGATSS